MRSRGRGRGIVQPTVASENKDIPIAINEAIQTDVWVPHVSVGAIQRVWGGAPGKGGNADRVGVPLKQDTEYGKSRVST